MKQEIAFAQKAITFRRGKGLLQLLLIKYKNGKMKYLVQLAGKYACPGGKISFNEDLDDSLIREVEEETGITIKPTDKIAGLSRWIVEKPNKKVDIIAAFRVCEYVEGKPKTNIQENETLIEKAEWVNINTFNLRNIIIEDEIDPISKALKLI